MRDFTITFTHPWLLLLLIPAVVLLVIAILRVPRKYRNTRNRVVSVVLEAIVVFCAVLLLAGLGFSYTLANVDNEVILLVDMSDTMEESAENRDDYVRMLIEYGEDEGCAMGIVTFGFTQVYAAPLSTDYGSLYVQYVTAELPDTSATDLSAALEYACGRFTNPETSKIVVISDGKETDESALNTLAWVTSQGTVVETVYIPTQYEGIDVQIVGIDLPDYHVKTDTPFDITVKLQSNISGDVSFAITDNGNPIEFYFDTEDEDAVEEDGIRSVKQGSSNCSFTCVLSDKYLHEIKIVMYDELDDSIAQNNEYCIYIYIDNFNNILIFESSSGQSETLVDALNEKEPEPGDVTAYNIDIINLGEELIDYLPTTVDELRQYDLVILNNVSNSDMYDAYLVYLDSVGLLDEYSSYFYYATSGNKKDDGGLLPQLLDEYVSAYGGGLLTAGGTDDDDMANAYSRSDLYGTTLQKMMPVSAINYTPATGVIFIIDTSGSMGTGEGSVLQYAVNGAVASIDLLGVNDYVGIIDFSSTGEIILGLTSLTYSADIKEALNSLYDYPQSGGTVLKGSLSTAMSMLNANSNLFERKHIVVVTDGQLADTAQCVELAGQCAEQGITISAMVVGTSAGYGYDSMLQICQAADGTVVEGETLQESRYIYNCTGSDQDSVGMCIMYDLQAIIWEEINYDETRIGISSSYKDEYLVDGLYYYTWAEGENGELYEVYDTNYLYAYLSRFYGSTLKAGATLVLVGAYDIPIYAQWSYGNGMVGSYLGDLYKDDSGYRFILDEPEGKLFITNVVDNLVPGESIRPTGITATLSEDNYTNKLTVYASDLVDGYTIDATIYGTNGEEWSLNSVTEGDYDDLDFYCTVAMNPDNNYNRANFVIKKSGVYSIVITMYDADGNAVKNEKDTYVSTTLYKVFSYSDEYRNFDTVDGEDLMNSLSTGEYGMAITDAEDLEYVFSGFVSRIFKEYDPRLILAIVAVCLFLLGIAVRKFKWKWPHELVRERRQKKTGR